VYVLKTELLPDMALTTVGSLPAFDNVQTRVSAEPAQTFPKEIADGETDSLGVPSI
jgi:hypothetical protein